MPVTTEYDLLANNSSVTGSKINSVLPLEVYLKIQTLHVKNIIFILGLINQMTL